MKKILFLTLWATLFGLGKASIGMSAEPPSTAPAMSEEYADINPSEMARYQPDLQQRMQQDYDAGAEAQWGAPH